MPNASIGLPGSDSLPHYLAYSAGGFVIGGANLIIVLSICRYEALRSSKVHLVMLSLAYADLANMLAYTLAGMYRIQIVFSGQHSNLVSPWSCALLPQTLLWVLIGTQGSSIQLLVVSIDRLLATTFPLEYIGWSRKTYITPLMLASHGWAFCTGVLGIWLAYTKRHDLTVKAACSSTSTMIVAGEDTFYSIYYTFSTPSFSSASVVVYLLVLAQYYHKRNQVHASQGHNIPVEVKEQRKFTRTLGYSCLCAFFLYTLPVSVANRLRWLGMGSWGSLFFAISNLNPFMNLVIYQFYQPEMRQATVGLVKCKQMPIDVKQWKANAHAANNYHVMVL